MTSMGDFESVAPGPATVATLATLPEARWGILSTSSARTLPLARSLGAAGLDAWAPLRTIRTPMPGQRRAIYLGVRPRMREKDLAILPGFVFVNEAHLDDLARVVVEDALAHPPFSIFHLAGRAGLVGSASLAGLREEEQAAAVAIQAQRDAETRAQAQRARADQMRNDRLRRTALRRERRDFEQGQKVTVSDMPSMVGVVGIVEESNGTKARVHFGGSLTMEIEAWQVIPAPLLDGHA